jgi:para-nitrobenzyl esterase
MGIKAATIMTPCGAARGIEEDGVLVFRGLRYAVAARFEKPEEVVSWEGEFDATTDGPACFQRASFGISDGFAFYDEEFLPPGLPEPAEAPSYGEDCLRLNIVAPAGAAVEANAAGRRLPVIAFIHGGGHDSGRAGELPFGATREYARRGIVFVSIEYRLNVFSLYCDESHGGNLCLHDQLAALRWIRRNIASFGGDGDRITVMGQSAGAMNLMDLCLSRQARGLVRGAICMSGGGLVPSPFGPAEHRKTEGFWRRVAELAGAASFGELSACDPEKLWRAWFAARDETGDMGIRQPCIDGEILAAAPERVIEARGQLDIPYMLGVTSQDMMPPVLFWMARRWARIQARSGMKAVYGYFFDRAPPGGKYKAFHAADLWYVFGGMDRSRRAFEAIDRELARRMMDYVAAFARTGDPNGPGLAEWRPLSRRGRGFMRFDGVSEGRISNARCWAKLLASALWDKGPM